LCHYCCATLFFRSIKLSSYKLSNITAVGCIFIYGAVILLGLSSYPTVCMARVYLLSSGFSLTFGSMFAKTYRVHRIFIHNWGGVYCKDKMLKDRKLISMVCCLLLVDGLFVSCWTLLDPMQRNLRNLTLEISHTDRSVVYQPQVEVCESLNTKSWFLFLYAYKGLLLAVGVYMAWETRHVKIPVLNDSKYIGISVYGAVITSVSVVVFANILADKVTVSFIIIATIVLTSTTATLCLVFVPKMSAILNKGEWF
jgi:gamma-aminobutyric acid type B receptor